jgi:hypothetical protein
MVKMPLSLVRVGAADTLGDRLTMARLDVRASWLCPRCVRQMRLARRSPRMAAALQKRAHLVGDKAKWRITNSQSHCWV